MVKQNKANGHDRLLTNQAVNIEEFPVLSLADSKYILKM